MSEKKNIAGETVKELYTPGRFIVAFILFSLGLYLSKQIIDNVWVLVVIGFILAIVIKATVFHEVVGQEQVTDDPDKSKDN